MCRDLLLTALEEVQEFIKEGDGDKDVLNSPILRIIRKDDEYGLRGIMFLNEPKEEVPE